MPVVFSGKLEHIWFMAVPPVIASLPLSQQIVAWGLRALGHGDSPGPGVSRSTLRNAQAGKLIPGAWNELVASMLRRLGVQSPREDLYTIAGTLMHEWDLMVGALPPASELSLAERIHAPLVCAIPAAGIRLGAMAAYCALTTRTPIKEWLWVVEPLNERFFGRVARALLNHRFPGNTNEQLKSKVRELRRGGKSVDWRTIERWLYGETEAPTVKSLELLAEVLDNEAEAMLRAARLMGILREDLSEWIGVDAMTEWAEVVTEVGRATAQLLSEPGEIVSLLRQICEDLEGPHGDMFHANLRLLLQGDAKDRSRSELIAVLVSTAEHVDTHGVVDHPIARWFISRNILVVFPHLEVRVWQMLGGNPVGYLTAKNMFGHIHRDWAFRTLMKAIACGGTLRFSSADGAQVEYQVSDAMQETARRCEATSLRFRKVDEDDDLTFDVGLMLVRFNPFGPEGFLEADYDTPLAFDLLGHVLDPSAEIALSDDQVRASVPLSLARVRRLLSAGCLDSAIRWFPDHRMRRLPLSQAAITGFAATYAAIAHCILDQQRERRGRFRTAAPGDRDQMREALVGAAPLIERFLAAILQVGQAPEGSQTLLETLVHAVPVAVRVMLLRQELDIAQAGLTSEEEVGRLIERLDRCLQLHRSHGHGWAVLALWFRLCELGKEQGYAERKASHFGAGHIVEQEWTRLLGDFSFPGESGEAAV